jgi:hypothetical protein
MFVAAVILLTIASSRTFAAVNLLVDPEFDGSPALNTFVTVFGPPFITGQWGAESGAIVGITDGITPLTAKSMLAEYDTGSYSQTMQATDVSAVPALSMFTLSAYFNANKPAAEGYVNLSFYDASYNFLGVQASSPLQVLDSNVNTWEQISLTLAEPLSTRYVVSQVMYRDATIANSDGTTGAGYVDSASLTAVPEPASIMILGLAVAGLQLRRRHRAASPVIR